MWLLSIASIPILLVPFAWSQMLDLNPTQITAGETATLSWTVSSASFIAGYGKVDQSGSALIRPSVTTQFTLTTLSQGQYLYLSKTLEVSGAKGEDEVPAMDLFDPAVPGLCTKMSFIDFQSYAWDILQRNYYLKGDYAPRRPFIVFLTNFSLRPDLVTPDDTGIRARRIAFAIQIDEPRGEHASVPFEVRALLEYQHRGESTWRPERNSPLARSEVQKLIATLEKGH